MLHVGGTITYEDVTNVDSLGLGTFRSGMSKYNTGCCHNSSDSSKGTLESLVSLPVGTASVTIDGDNNTVSVGLVTITN